MVAEEPVLVEQIETPAQDVFEVVESSKVGRNLIDSINKKYDGSPEFNEALVEDWQSMQKILETFPKEGDKSWFDHTLHTTLEEMGENFHDLPALTQDHVNWLASLAAFNKHIEILVSDNKSVESSSSIQPNRSANEEAKYDSYKQEIKQAVSQTLKDYEDELVEEIETSGEPKLLEIIDDLEYTSFTSEITTFMGIDISTFDSRERRILRTKLVEQIEEIQDREQGRNPEDYKVLRRLVREKKWVNNRNYHFNPSETDVAMLREHAKEIKDKLKITTLGYTTRKVSQLIQERSSQLS